MPYIFENNITANELFDRVAEILDAKDVAPANLNKMIAKGLDIEASYRFNVEEMFGRGVGDMSLRAMFTHYIENVTDDGVTAIDQAGSNAGSTPDWVYRLSATWKVEDWTTTFTARGVSDGVISNAYTECTSACPTLAAPYFTINDNHIDGATYYDLSVSRAFQIGDTKGEAYVSIKNVFNKDPILTANPANLGAENTPAYLQTNRGLYDVLGRVWRFGLRLDF